MRIVKTTKNITESDLVVSIGRLTAFYVVLVPIELIPSEPPHFAYIIVLAKSFHFLASRFYKTRDIYRLKDMIDWYVFHKMNNSYCH